MNDVELAVLDGVAAGIDGYEICNRRQLLEAS